jgi:predicted O-methyltransferase YrrM
MGQRAIGEYYRPILSSMFVAGIEIETSVDDVMHSLDLPFDPADRSAHLDDVAKTFPVLYNSGGATLDALWHVVRAVKPEVVIETGVANGLSTRTLLEALNKNGFGRLVSFDVDPRASQSVPESLKSNWEFVLLKSGSAESELQRIAQTYSNHVGIWFHDSDHSYSWQLMEYDLAAKLLEPGGLLISDDVDGTEAFADFCSAHSSWMSRGLFDTRKVCGFSRKPDHGFPK